MFSISTITPLAWVLLGIGLLAAILFAIFGPGRYRQLIRVVRLQSAQEETSIPLDADGRPLRLSIVAASKGDFHEIKAFLQGITAQDYPDVEVIIVVDGAARDASNLAEAFASSYPNASFTFVPPEARNLSRRKLANTIGIKKASGQLILTTLTNITIPSERWLSLMASRFAEPEVEIVVGAAFMNLSPLSGISRWYRHFDSLLRTEEWMLAAIDDSPYRGDGANLAFRRDLFYRNSGYGSNYFLHAGDDDIFVSQVATAANSRFMYASEATIRVEWAQATDRMWVSQKERYSFTEKYLPRAPRRRRALLSLSCWLGFLAPVAAMAISLLHHDLIIPIAATVLLLAQWSWQITCYRRLATALASMRLWWSVPLFYLWRPLADIIFNIRYRSLRASNFTWRR